MGLERNSEGVMETRGILVVTDGGLWAYWTAAVIQTTRKSYGQRANDQ